MCAFHPITKQTRNMSTFDIISIIFLTVFTLACVVVAIIFGVWWYYGTAALTALLAGAVFEESKNDNT